MYPYLPYFGSICADLDNLALSDHLLRIVSMDNFYDFRHVG